MNGVPRRSGAPFTVDACGRLPHTTCRAARGWLVPRWLVACGGGRCCCACARRRSAAPGARRRWVVASRRRNGRRRRCASSRRRRVVGLRRVVVLRIRAWRRRPAGGGGWSLVVRPPPCALGVSRRARARGRWCRAVLRVASPARRGGDGVAFARRRHRVGAASGGAAFARHRRLVVSPGGGASRSRGAVARRWWRWMSQSSRSIVVHCCWRCWTLPAATLEHFRLAHLRVRLACGPRVALRARLITPRRACVTDTARPSGWAVSGFARRAPWAGAGSWFSLVRVVARGRFSNGALSVLALSSASSPRRPGRSRFLGCSPMAQRNAGSLSFSVSLFGFSSSRGPYFVACDGGSFGYRAPPRSSIAGAP